MNVALFDTLENDYVYYESIGAVYSTGDFNGRVGVNDDYIPSWCFECFF